jgi:hypothetical protein
MTETMSEFKVKKEKLYRGKDQRLHMVINTEPSGESSLNAWSEPQ